MSCLQARLDRSGSRLLFQQRKTLDQRQYYLLGEHMSSTTQSHIPHIRRCGEITAEDRDLRDFRRKSTGLFCGHPHFTGARRGVARGNSARTTVAFPREAENRRMQPGGLIGIRRHFSGPSIVVYIVAVSESAKARALIQNQLSIAAECVADLGGVKFALDGPFRSGVRGVHPCR